LRPKREIDENGRKKDEKAEELMKYKICLSQILSVPSALA